MAAYEKGDVLKNVFDSTGAFINYLVVTDEKSQIREYTVIDLMYFKDRDTLKYNTREKQPRKIDVRTYPPEEFKVDQDKNKKELIRTILSVSNFRVEED